MRTSDVMRLADRLGERLTQLLCPFGWEVSQAGPPDPLGTMADPLTVYFKCSLRVTHPASLLNGQRLGVRVSVGRYQLFDMLRDESRVEDAARHLARDATLDALQVAANASLPPAPDPPDWRPPVMVPEDFHAG